MDVRLDSLRWIEPLPIAVLVAYLLDHHRRTGEGGRITIPPRYGYLQRMDFFKVVGVEGIKEGFERHDSEGRFVPVREIQRSGEVHEAAAEIVSTLHTDPEAARVLRHVLGEVLDNVFVHAESSVNAIVCAQHYPNGRYTQVGIVDTGMGFRATFENSPEYSTMDLTDREAIKLGLAPLITSKPYAHTAAYGQSLRRLGIGLFIVSEVLSTMGGKILVASGDTVFRRGRNRRWITVRRPWQGAIVGLQVPDDPEISLDEALRTAREAGLLTARERAET